MKLIVIENNKARINRFIDWLIHMIGYTIVFVLLTSLFDSIVIKPEHRYLFCFVIVLIIYILNKTVKPILVNLTIPITGITLGLFYPFINLFILKLADWILFSYFDLTNIWIALIFSILLSIVNLISDYIIEKIIARSKKWIK